jgi:peptidoglycan/LPS O-acetylase OafA/YrhL
LNLEANQAINIPKFSITLGDASYVLYLIHFPMLLLMNKIPMIVGLVLTDVETIWYNYFIIIVIVVVSIIIHKLVEKPLSKYLLVLSKS